MFRLTCACLLPSLLASRLLAGAPTGADIQAALEAAGSNRSELASFLASAERSGDPDKLAAARFLVANMPGKGHVVFELRDPAGHAVSFDPLAFRTLTAASGRLDAIEKERGPLEDVRARFIPDLETLSAAFLERHVDRSLAIWRATPPSRHQDFATFLDFVLPYRGSEEPVEDWLRPMQARLSPALAKLPPGADAAVAWAAVNAETWKRMRFDDRYYLHPTDQSFSQMESSHMGRCEDLTNMLTYGARALGLATATDYTPAWGHSDNNHAWNVLLDANGHGSDAAGARAAKVYRKTFSLRDDAPAMLVPAGREAPNRWLATRNQVDVTEQYGPTTDVTLDVADAHGEQAAWICVFNGGEWVAIGSARIEDGRATFERMGRNLAYLPAVHDGTKLIAIGPPLLVAKDGVVTPRPGAAAPVSLIVNAVSPSHAEDAAASHLDPGTRYTLSSWRDGAWTKAGEAVATSEPLRFEGLPSDGLYWLVREDSHHLERIFTIEDGAQRWW